MAFLRPIWICCFAAVACSSFAPRSSEDRPSGDRGSGAAKTSTPPTFVPRGLPPEADAFASNASHLFALNPQAKSLSIFDLTLVEDESPFVTNIVLPLSERYLVAPSGVEVAAVLFPREGQLALICPDPPSSVMLEVAPGTDAALAVELADGSTRLLAYGSGRGSTPPSANVSIVTAKDCRPGGQEVETRAVGKGSHEARVPAGQRLAYISSESGVSRIDLGDDGLPVDPISAQGLRDLELATPSADRSYLVGRSDLGITLIDVSAGSEPTTIPGSAAGTEAPPTGAIGGAGGADAGESEPGGTEQGGAGAGQAGDPGSAGSGPPPVTSDASFAVARSGAFVLVTDGTQLLRQELPLPAAPPRAIASAATQLAMGEADDCALAYTPGRRSLTKLTLDPLSATELELERRVQSVHLLCRPDTGQGATCCDGVALVSYASTPSPLGQTEGFSLVHLETMTDDLRRSSLPILGFSRFDAGNALLLALGDDRSAQGQFSLITPFEAAPDLDGDLSDAAIAVEPSTTPPDVGFLGLRRRDGGVLFAFRPTTTPTPMTPADYRLKRLGDFRLPERVTPLTGSQP